MNGENAQRSAVETTKAHWYSEILSTSVSISRQTLPVKRTIVLPWSFDSSSDVQ